MVTLCGLLIEVRYVDSCIPVIYPDGPPPIMTQCGTYDDSTDDESRLLGDEPSEVL